MLRPHLGLFALALACAAARADDQSARVRLEGWTAPSRGRSGADLATQVELSPRVRLEALVSRSDGDGGPAEWGWARLEAGWFRLAGGVTGDDGGVHLGFAPSGRLELSSAVALEGGLDFSLGAGFLGGDRRQPTGRHADLWPEPVDFWAAGLAARLELQVTPWDGLVLGAGAHGAVTAVAGPPVAGQPPEALARVAREVDLDLLGALSQAEGGVWLRGELRVWQGELLAAPASLHLAYVEAWDQVHLDPLYTSLRLASDDLDLGPIPWRTTRTAQATWRWGGAQRRLELSIDLQHVRGSTTLERFGERNGWSVGGRAAARWDRLLIDVSARWALSPADVESVVGDLARARISCRAGVVLYETSGLAVRAEAGLEAGLSDELGLPREGLAFLGGLTVELGSPSRPFCDPRTDPFSRTARAERAIAPAPTLLAPDALPLDRAAAAERTLPALTARPTIEQVETLLDRFTPEELASTLGLELPSPDRIDDYLDRHPGQIERIDQQYPGAGDLIRRAIDALRGQRRPTAVQPGAAAGGRALVLGHGLAGPRVALLSASHEGEVVDALTVRLDGRPDLRVGELDQTIDLATHAGFAGYRGSQALEKWTLLRPGSREPWLQGRSAWSRSMHRFVTGR